MDDGMHTARTPERDDTQPPFVGPRVVVFDAEADTRERLSDAIARLGLSVLEAKTPLEAIYALTRASKDACVAFIGGRLTDETTPLEFVGFALEEFPRLTLVTSAEVPEHERVHKLRDDEPPTRLVDLLAILGPTASRA